MKTINKIVSLAIVGCATVLVSCNDWLALKPQNAVPASDYWNSASNAEAALTGIYCDAMSIANTMLRHGELQADCVTEGRSTLAMYQQIHQGNIISTNSFCSWSGYYSVINSCNLLLDHIDEVLDSDRSFSPALCAQYKAEARVMRAWMYFYLIRIWKDVPYITWGYYSDEVERSVAPSSQLDILDKLIQELEEVKDLRYAGKWVLGLPEPTKLSAPESWGRFTRPALLALLADMYRMKAAYQSDPSEAQTSYQSCVDLCDEVLGQAYKLEAVERKDIRVYGDDNLSKAVIRRDSLFYFVDEHAADQMFYNLYVSGISKEIIFALHADDYNICNDLYRDHVSTRYLATNDAHISDDLFPATDNEIARGSSANYRDVRYKMCSKGIGENKFVWKYAGPSLDADDEYKTNTDFVKNFIVYRLAEIYLMKAEALTQIAMINGDDPAILLQAYLALYQVRSRANAVETTDVSASSGATMEIAYFDELQNGTLTSIPAGEITSKDMQTVIFNEEARELMFEGKRWFDMIRHAERQNATASNNLSEFLTSLALKSAAEGKNAVVETNWKNPDRHYLPYPHQDVQLNDKLSQKPVYGTE